MKTNQDLRELTDAIDQLVRTKLALRMALSDLQTQVRAHVKFDVRKHYSLMVADAAATAALSISLPVIPPSVQMTDEEKADMKWNSQ